MVLENDKFKWLAPYKILPGKFWYAYSPAFI